MTGTRVEIIGLSHAERELVANIVRFNHSRFSYQGSRQDYLTVAKLTAILRLANSLDRSHKQKFTELKATLQEQELVLSVDTSEDISLEQGFFAPSAEFFAEVFSVQPVLKQKKGF